jgi:hypothetical protein
MSDLVATAEVTSPRRRLAALASLCRALAGELGGGSEASPRGPLPVAWNDVLALARELVVEPALWSAVYRAHDEIPAGVIEELRRSHLVNTIHNLRLRHALTEAARSLNESGVVPCLIKGAVHLVDGTPGAAGGRWMVDLDLVVPEDQMRAAGAALTGLGYAADPGKPFLHPHELPFGRERSPGPIELHVALGSPPIPSVLPFAEAWEESTELNVADVRVRVLSPTHQVLHNILHSAVQDLNHVVAGLPLRQLLGLSSLVRAHGAAVDWRMIRSRMDDHGLGTALRDHLWLAHRFAGMPLPEGKWSGSRLHEVRVLAGFALGWPPEVERNLRYAFGRTYLDSLYGHGNRPWRLLGARGRHAVRILRRDGRGVLGDVLRPRK